MWPLGRVTSPKSGFFEKVMSSIQMKIDFFSCVCIIGDEDEEVGKTVPWCGGCKADYLVIKSDLTLIMPFHTKAIKSHQFRISVLRRFPGSDLDISFACEERRGKRRNPTSTMIIYKFSFDCCFLVWATTS